MKFLVDTHALLWWLFDDARLPPRTRTLIADPRHQILVSSASAWEIATKHRLGRLPAARVLVRDMADWLRRAGFDELPIRLDHAVHAGGWPQDHRDPFDRMLAAQSAVEDLPLISSDRALSAFGIRLVW